VVHDESFRGALHQRDKSRPQLIELYSPCASFEHTFISRFAQTTKQEVCAIRSVRGIRENREQKVDRN